MGEWKGGWVGAWVGEWVGGKWMGAWVVAWVAESVGGWAHGREDAWELGGWMGADWVLLTGIERVSFPIAEPVAKTIGPSIALALSVVLVHNLSLPTRFDLYSGHIPHAAHPRRPSPT